jgi:hypothetical protein
MGKFFLVVWADVHQPVIVCFFSLARFPSHGHRWRRICHEINKYWYFAVDASLAGMQRLQ